jgi:hypothetical protein
VPMDARTSGTDQANRQPRKRFGVLLHTGSHRCVRMKTTSDGAIW